MLCASQQIHIVLVLNSRLLWDFYAHLRSNSTGMEVNFSYDPCIFWPWRKHGCKHTRCNVPCMLVLYNKFLVIRDCWASYFLSVRKLLLTSVKFRIHNGFITLHVQHELPGRASILNFHSDNWEGSSTSLISVLGC